MRLMPNEPSYLQFSKEIICVYKNENRNENKNEIKLLICYAIQINLHYFNVGHTCSNGSLV